MNQGEYFVPSQRRVTSAYALLPLAIAFTGGCGESQQSAPAVQEDVRLSPEQEFAALTKKAEAGDTNAQHSLGKMYASGEGVAKDDAKAVEWYQKAAEQGNKDAQFEIAYCYTGRCGLKRDATKSAEWFQKAAEQGHAKAQFHLGLLYLFNQDLLARDGANAAEWLQKAAEQGFVDAQNLLGLMYRDGVGVAKNSAKAVEWYRKAAEQGDESAEFWLGYMYGGGEGVPKDAAKAIEWYQRAAAKGNSLAQLELGVAYGNGDGASKDSVLAYAWFNLAATDDKQTDAVKNRGIVESRLSKADLAEAQRLSSNWKKGQLLVREGSPTVSVPSNIAGSLSKKIAGTIFVVSKTGHAITNQHVAGGCTELRVPGRDGLAKLITEDTVNDLALVQIQGFMTDTATIAAEPGKLRQGEDIVAFGFPLNSVLSSGGNLSPGVVSALTGLGNNTNQIQITAPIQPGSSGSPVLNKKGEVVGVVSMKLSDSKMAKATGSVGQNINFAVSGQTLKTFLDTHNVNYSNGSGLFTRDKSTADLADDARKWTLVVECWK